MTILLKPGSIEIVTARGVQHLADRLSLVAWCGASLSGGISTAVLEPGSDVGEHKGDCLTCAAKLKARRS